MSDRLQQRLAVMVLANAVVDAVRGAGSMGAPAGTLYAALMAHGCTLAQFESLMAGLVRVGRLTQAGHLYRAI